MDNTVRAVIRRAIINDTEHDAIIVAADPDLDAAHDDRARRFTANQIETEIDRVMRYLEALASYCAALIRRRNNPNESN